MKKAAKSWTINVLSGLRFGQKFPNNYIELKYEDLLENPYKTLARLKSRNL